MAYYFPEPHRVKVVEPLKFTTIEQRREALRKADYNMFGLHADDVYLDLQTDSGNGAMSHMQWAAIMRGDESYAGASSYYTLGETVTDIFGFKHFAPTHQGRASENLLCQCLVKQGSIVVSNYLFDTTEANVQVRGGSVTNFPLPEAFDANLEAPFKGNIDIPRLREFVEKEHAKIPFGMMVVTSNTAAGQPVSMQNIREASKIFRQYRIPMFIDAARYAENCLFIKEREAGYETKSLKEIAKELFSYADGMAMSCKKNGNVNIGGLLCCNDDTLFENIKVEMTIREGFPTYGGQAGRDLECLSVGLYEALDENFMRFRIGQVRYLADSLAKIGVPVVKPSSGHAVYVDARAILPNVATDSLPAQALAVQLYLLGGIRASPMKCTRFDMVRITVPQRTYCQAHLDYVVSTFKEIMLHAKDACGFRITYAPPILKCFTAKYEPIPLQPAK